MLFSLLIFPHTQKTHTRHKFYLPLSRTKTYFFPPAFLQRTSPISTAWQAVNAENPLGSWGSGLCGADAAGFPPSCSVPGCRASRLPRFLSLHLKSRRCKRMQLSTRVQPKQKVSQCVALTSFSERWLIHLGRECGRRALPGYRQRLVAGGKCFLLLFSLQTIYFSFWQGCKVCLYPRKGLTCLLFDFTQNAEECWFHSVTVQSVFPVSV